MNYKDCNAIRNYSSTLPFVDTGRCIFLYLDSSTHFYFSLQIDSFLFTTLTTLVCSGLSGGGSGKSIIGNVVLLRDYWVGGFDNFCFKHQYFKLSSGIFQFDIRLSVVVSDLQCLGIFVLCPAISIG